MHGFCLPLAQTLFVNTFGKKKKKTLQIEHALFKMFCRKVLNLGGNPFLKLQISLVVYKQRLKRMLHVPFNSAIMGHKECKTQDADATHYWLENDYFLLHQISFFYACPSVPMMF